MNTDVTILNTIDACWRLAWATQGGAVPQKLSYTNEQKEDLTITSCSHASSCLSCITLYSQPRYKSFLDYEKVMTIMCSVIPSHLLLFAVFFYGFLSNESGATIFNLCIL